MIANDQRGDRDGERRCRGARHGRRHHRRPPRQRLRQRHPPRRRGQQTRGDLGSGLLAHARRRGESARRRDQRVVPPGPSGALRARSEMLLDLGIRRAGRGRARQLPGRRTVTSSSDASQASRPIVLIVLGVFAVVILAPPDRSDRAAAPGRHAAGAEGPFGDLEDAGDVDAAHPFEVAERERGPEIVGQVAERGGQPREQLPVRGLLVRSRGHRGDWHLGDRRHGRAPADLPARMVAPDVHRDADDPGRDGRPAVVARGGALHLEEGGLDDVVEIAAIDRAQPPEDAVDGVAVTLEQLLEGGVVAGGDRGQQRVVRQRPRRAGRRNGSNRSVIVHRA